MSFSAFKRGIIPDKDTENYYDDFVNQAILVYNAVDNGYMGDTFRYLNKKYGSLTGYIRI